MALNKLKFNSLNVTPVAGKTVGFNSSADGLEATLSGGAMTFISKSTASSSSTISFTSGIDSTYKEYIFVFKDIHPSAGGSDFTFQADTGTNTSYNQTITSTSFRAFQVEDASVTAFGYRTDEDLAQSTSFQPLQTNLGDDDDQCFGCYLHIFNPSSSTFVKHFIANTQASRDNTGGVTNGTGSSYNSYVAGYFNTTTAITRFQFKYSSGNIDAGTITLYGIN